MRRTAGLVLLLVAASCGGQDAGDPPSDPPSDAGSTTGSAISGEILVSAAASLTDAFEAVASDFEAAHAGVEVLLNLGGSSSLRAQILEGAPADVFASANTSNMERLVEAGEVSGRARVFARNRLRIAVPAGNPARIDGLDDFASDALRLGLCAEQVPCGALARQALARAGVVPSLDTNEPDVRALLTKIELGELDAGITYVTDVASTAGGVEGIDIPDDVNLAAEYPIAVLAGAPNPAAAEAFVRFVLSDAGRAILESHGFTPP